MKSRYFVYGWLNGCDHDAGRPADKVVKVTASCPSRAEDLGDKKLEKEIGRCDVVIAEIGL